MEAHRWSDLKIFCTLKYMKELIHGLIYFIIVSIMINSRIRIYVDLDFFLKLILPFRETSANEITE